MGIGWIYGERVRKAHCLHLLIAKIPPYDHACLVGIPIDLVLVMPETDDLVLVERGPVKPPGLLIHRESPIFTNTNAYWRKKYH